ncbi:hypothetical protein T484DRAFT_1779830 [Baffinella frigidus]|nr:hypothetical protein T484DRAFT_1779830 [Cryptophyta sp. CCMP2293]
MAPSQWLLLAVVLVGCAPGMCSGDGGVLAERAKRMTTELPAEGALEREHPFQTFLHRYMRGLGSELTQGDRVGGRGSKLADSQGKPMLADGEEGGEQEYKEININEPIFMEQGEFTKNADDWMEEHEDEMRGSVRWMMIGGLLCFVAALVLIYSEVRPPFCNSSSE